MSSVAIPMAPEAKRPLSEVLVVALCILSLVVLFGYFVYCIVTSDPPAYVTVTILGARGLDVDEPNRTAPVEFDVDIGISYLPSHRGFSRDGGDVAISYAGVKLAEGPVPRFYVAGGPNWVEATRAVAKAGKDQAPLSQVLRYHVWVAQQMDGEAEFDVALSFYKVNVTTGAATCRSYHNCKAGLALHGNSTPSNCGDDPWLP
ncbi:hypothetical protein ACP70R_037086 [Stipagrostis hirtigluma subsp. patula]